MTPLHQLIDLARSQDMAWDAGQEPLTAELLRPVLPGLVDTLGRLRLQTDAWIAQSAAPPSYPIGFCAVIRDRVFDGLLGDPLVQGLIADGLVLKKVFVILKDRYFQNAIQFGNLYIDVANDTVDPSKPWLEWMDVRSVPFENVGELPTLIRVAESYHRCRAFPNVFFPLLAPVVPLLAIAEDGRLGLLHFQDGGFLKDLAGGLPQLHAWLAGPARDLPSLPPAYATRLQRACGANDFTAFPFEYRLSSFADIVAQADDYAAAFADPNRHDAILGVLDLVPAAARALFSMEIRCGGAPPHAGTAG
jgi:hypothetical protein